MKKFKKLLVAVLLAFCVGSSTAIFAACDDSNSSDGDSTPVESPETTVSSVAISGSTSVTVGGSITLIATATFSDNTTSTTETVSWSSSDTSIATVSSSGVVTGVAQGTVTITATAGGKSGTYSVTVSEALSTATVTSIAISGATSVAVDSTITLTATATFSDNTTSTTETVSWSSSDPSIATVTSSSGVVTGVKEGTVTITAAIGEISDTYSITVTEKQAVNETYSVDFDTYSADAATISDKLATSTTLYFNDTTYSESKLSDGIISYTTGASGTSSDYASSASASGNYYLTTGGSSQATKARYFTIDLSDYVGNTATVSVEFGITGDTRPGRGVSINAGSSYTVYSQGGALSGLASYATAASLYNSTTSKMAGTATLNYQAVVSSSAKTLYISCNDSVAYFGITVTVDETECTATTADTASAFTLSGDATVTAGYTTTLTPSSTATWTTSDSDTATVEGGVVTGVAAGTAAITAVSGNHTIVTDVTVEAPSLALSDDSVAGVVGTDLDLSTYVETNLASTDLSWTIKSGSDYATLSGSTLTPTAAGTTVVTVSYGDLSADITVTITSSLVPTIELTSGLDTPEVLIGYSTDITSYFTSNVDLEGFTFTTSDTNGYVTATYANSALTLAASGSATAGTYTVTATYTKDSSVKAELTVTVASSVQIINFVVDNYVKADSTIVANLSSVNNYFTTSSYSTTSSTGAILNYVATTDSDKFGSSSIKSGDGYTTIYSYYLQYNGKTSSSSRYMVIDLSSYVGLTYSITAITSSKGTGLSLATAASVETNDILTNSTSTSNYSVSDTSYSEYTLSATGTVATGGTYYLVNPSSNTRIYSLVITISLPTE